MQSSMLDWREQEVGGRPRRPVSEGERYRASRRLQDTRSLTPPRTPPKSPKPPVIPDRPLTDGPSQQRKASLPGPGYCKPICPPSLKGSSLSARIERISLARTKMTVAAAAVEPQGPITTPPRTRARFAKQLLEQSRAMRPGEEWTGKTGTTGEGKHDPKKPEEAPAVTEAAVQQGDPDVRDIPLSHGEAVAAGTEECMKENRQTTQEKKADEGRVEGKAIAGDSAAEKNKPGENETVASKDKETELDSSGIWQTGDAEVSEDKEEGVIDPRPQSGLVEVATSVIGIPATQFQASALLRKKSPIRSSVRSKA